MSKPNRNDISIGKGKWITFVELDGQQTDAIDLDEILKPIEPFLNSLETECVAGCCGVDAYALWPEDIAGAAKQSDLSNLSRSIETARKQIIDSGGDSFVSHRMNNFFQRQTLLQLIDHIARCVGHANDVGEQSGEPESPITRNLKS
jgi:hypothetical protein